MLLLEVVAFRRRILAAAAAIEAPRRKVFVLSARLLLLRGQPRRLAAGRGRQRCQGKESVPRGWRGRRGSVAPSRLEQMLVAPLGESTGLLLADVQIVHRQQEIRTDTVDEIEIRAALHAVRCLLGAEVGLRVDAEGQAPAEVHVCQLVLRGVRGCMTQMGCMIVAFCFSAGMSNPTKSKSGRSF